MNYGTSYKKRQINEKKKTQKFNLSYMRNTQGKINTL